MNIEGLWERSRKGRWKEIFNKYVPSLGIIKQKINNSKIEIQKH